MYSGFEESLSAKHGSEVWTAPVGQAWGLSCFLPVFLAPVIHC